MTWDVIVVGAGSAGCVLAGRLSEHPDRTVLLLEAGPNRPGSDGLRSPNFFRALGEADRIRPGLVAAARPGRPPTTYLRGQGPGGSSAVNAMVGLWGTAADQLAWVEAGAVGWGWDDMARWRAAVEATVPLWRTPEPDWSPFERAFGVAALDLGHPWCADLLAAPTPGIGPVPLTRSALARASAADVYLSEAPDRGNLTVRGSALVDRVVLDGRVAVGVRLAGGEEVAGRHVVVAAGALESPAILLRSHVERAGIGANLVEHVSAGFAVALRADARLDEPDRSPLNSLLRYSSGMGTAGPLDMQLLPIGASGASTEGRGVALAHAAVMHAYSRGRVGLRSHDPAVPPDVDLRLLSDRRDLERLRDGLKRLRAIVCHPAVASISDGVFVDDRGTPVETLDVDAALDAWISGATGAYVHAAGTCRMGRPGDRMAVVDPKCRVIGLEGLSVADASVFPDAPRANPNLTVLATAERVAALPDHWPVGGRWPARS